MTEDRGSGPFDEHRAAWQEYTATPWGRIRYAVVAQTLRRTLAELTAADGGTGLRVLDVGGGDGLDALPLARLGHRVRVLDPSPALLADARSAAASSGTPLDCTAAGVDDLPGMLGPAGALGAPFDAVLCHFLLHYREDPQDTVRLLARAVRPGGLLSLTAPNRASEVLVRGVRMLDPASALDALDSTQQHVATFDTDVRWVDPDDVIRELHRQGFDRVQRFGIRCVVDLVVDDGLKRDPEFYASLERLELALADREPYVRTARMWHLVARRRPD